MEISLSTHLFVHHDLDELVASLFRDFGFSNAEIWSMPPHFPYRDEAAADRIAAMLSRFGVRVRSLHSPLYPDVRTYRKDRWYSLSSEDEEHRKASVDAAAAAGRWLARNGGGTLVVHTQFPSEDWYPRRWAAFRSSMNEILDRVPDGTRIAIENTPTPSGSVDIVMDLVARYPAPRVGLCLDIGHAHIREDIADAIRQAGPHLIHVHASDNNGDRDDHLVPGRGSIGWRRVAAALREAGFEGPVTLELRDPLRDGEGIYASFRDILSEARRAVDGFLGPAR